MVWFLSISVIPGSVMFGESLSEMVGIFGFGSLDDVTFVCEADRVGISISDDANTYG